MEANRFRPRDHIFKDSPWWYVSPKEVKTLCRFEPQELLIYWTTSGQHGAAELESNGYRWSAFVSGSHVFRARWAKGP